MCCMYFGRVWVENVLGMLFVVMSYVLVGFELEFIMFL